MAQYTYKDGKWLDKTTGEDVTLPDRFNEKGSGSPYISGDYKGYECPVSGKWVEGRAAHRENLKRTGCRIYEPGETEHFVKNAEREAEARDAKLVDKMINHMDRML